MPNPIELPPGCMVTDRRTWERQQRRLAALEHESSERAERIQHLRAANEALRRRVAEAEAIALDALGKAEKATSRSDRASDTLVSVKRALVIAERALEKVVDAGPTNTFGGDPKAALSAVRSAIHKLAGVDRL